jgi:hypothetical protein
MNDTQVAPGRRRWTQWLALGALLLSVLAGMLVPVYTDEIGWRFQERAWIDGGLDIGLNDNCGPNTIARAPWFMMPVRWYSATANRIFADPLFVRLEGVACALAWIALFWVLARRLESDDDRRALLRTLTLSLLGLGVLPYVLVISRPEQPLILATMLVLLLTFARAPSMNPVVLAWIKAVGILLLSTVALSYHIKGVLYAGVSGACLVVSARGRGALAPRLAGLAVLVALVLVSAKYWVSRSSCPGDPLLASLLDSENVASVLVNGGRLSAVVAKMIGEANPLAYVGLVAPRSDPLSDWMPRELFPWPVAILLLAGMFVLWGLALVLALVALSRFVFTARWRAVAEPRTLVAMAIFSLVLVWGASQLNKNFYEASHVLPSLVVLMLLCLSLPGGGLERNLSRLTNLALPFALCSQVIVLGMTVMPMVEASRAPGYIGRQPFSVAVFGYPAIQRDIATARAASGIPTDRRLERPLVDDLTYMALQDSHLPLHSVAVLGFWRGSITDPVGYLRSRNSDGVIVGCHLLPPGMRAVAYRSGEICAISRDGLARLASGD